MGERFQTLTHINALPCLKVFGSNLIPIHSYFILEIELSWQHYVTFNNSITRYSCKSCCIKCHTNCVYNFHLLLLVHFVSWMFCVWSVFSFFSFLSNYVSFHERSEITGHQGKGEAKSNSYLPFSSASQTLRH